MCKVILMVLMAIVSSNAVADWVEVGHNEVATVYADPTTIRKAGNRVKMWHLIDYKMVQVPEKPFKPYTSMRGHIEYDCKEEQSKILSTLFDTGKMSEGGTVDIDSEPGQWESFPPRSFNESLWKIACNKP